MRHTSRLLASCAAALPLLASSAFAQQAGQPTGGIEEITVTALRHAQNIMTVPAAIQATTMTQLNNEGIHDLTDIQFITPGYFVDDSSGYTQIFIRGIGNNIFVGADPSVASYVDDVPLIWGQMMNQFVDVSRVEVLKGAQGGLYGRNATGGVVNVVTEQPSTDEFYGHGFFRYGSFTTADAGAFVNMPLNDTMAVTFAAEHESHSAYIKNIADPDPYSAGNFPNGSFLGVLGAPFSSECGGKFCSPAESANIMNSGVNPHGLATQNTDGVDSKFLWQPISNFKATLAGDYYFKDDSDGNQNFTATPAVPEAYLQSESPLLQLAPGIKFPTEQGVPSKFETATGDNLAQELHDWGTSLTAVWNAPIADVTSITAYRGDHSILDADLCACDPPAGTAVVDIKRQFYYQEIRAVSTTDGPFHWLGGATFLDDHQTYNTDFVIAPIVDANTAHAYSLVQNWTVYGQVGYDITPDLNLTSSLRWETETNWTRFPTIIGATGITQFPGAAQESLDKLIPSATLSYSLDDGTVYVRWARGVKSGGVNPVASVGIFDFEHAPLSDGSVFGPEKVDTYEAGYKQSLMDHRLQLTGDVFYNKYNGLQESAHSQPADQSTIILAIVNAGSARTYGAEGTVSYQPIDPLTLGVNAGYLDAEYSTFVYGQNEPIGVINSQGQLGPVPLVPTNLSHTQMPSAPKWQLSFTGDLDQPLDDRFNLVGHVVESYISRQLFDQTIATNAATLGITYAGLTIPNAVAPGYWLTNLKIGVKTNDDAYELSAFVNNLFDQKYFTYGSVSAESGDLLGWGNPRVVGAEFDVNF
jgi:iron complex outermembrane recepter protein